jgi:hypothetical protein
MYGNGRRGRGRGVGDLGRGDLDLDSTTLYTAYGLEGQDMEEQDGRDVGREVASRDHCMYSRLLGVYSWTSIRKYATRNAHKTNEQTMSRAIR